VSEISEALARDIAAVNRIEAVPTLLEVLCDITGMRFAAVARVTDDSWTACAVKDDINFGLVAGGQLAVQTTLCLESKRSNAPIVIDHASLDPHYRDHHTTQLYRIESYISVPIVLASGQYFGNLCAIDPAPARVSDPKIVSMFTRFAALIAMALDNQIKRERDQTDLRDELARSELRDQFIAILGHDLRNPLQAVYATGALLERKLTDPTLIGLAARIRINVRRMSSLIDDVLDFARSRLGGGIGIQIAPTPYFARDLQAVIKELQDGQHDRQILSEIDVPGTVSCDMARMQQVASNLIGNALVHGAAISPVKVNAFTENSDLVLTVWNAGEPIAPDSIERIFEPFWRGSIAGNRQGLGLGLHICAQIVRGHGGTLSVTSTATEGTSFTARIPAASHSLRD
jgi:signal transduction histidine kinase